MGTRHGGHPVLCQEWGPEGTLSLTKHAASEGGDMGAVGPPIFTPTSLSPARIGLLLGRAGGETEARRWKGAISSPQPGMAGSRALWGWGCWTMVLTQQGIKLIRNFLGPSGGETPAQEVLGGSGVIHPSWGGHQHQGIIAPGVVWW